MYCKLIAHGNLNTIDWRISFIKITGVILLDLQNQLKMPILKPGQFLTFDIEMFILSSFI